MTALIALDESEIDGALAYLRTMIPDPPEPPTASPPPPPPAAAAALLPLPPPAKDGMKAWTEKG